MKFDLHVHQNIHSSDSKIDIREGLRYAKSIGLDGVCITDHDSLGMRSNAESLSKEHNLLVIVGVEIYSEDGDILCFGIDEMPTERLSAQNTIDFVQSRGGVCVAAHPFRNNNRGLGELIYDVDGLCAVEGYNGRTSSLNNDRCILGAKNSNIRITGGSDAHTVNEIGCCYTQFDTEIHCEEDFISALKQGKFRGVNIKK